MIRTALFALGLVAAAQPALAALVSETLQGRVQAVNGATGIEPGDPVTTSITFDRASEIGGFYDVTSLVVTLPRGIVLDESDDSLGLIQVSADGERVTSLFATLSIAEAAYGFAGGALEFQAFGDGSLDFIIAAGALPVVEGTVVPVPAALPLLATALGGLAWLRRRRAAK